MKLDKYLLNLAGEYRVCSELLKLGLFATITYGNKKGADVFAIGPNRKAAVVEVKTSSANKKKFVTGFFQKYKTENQEHPDFWVLCRLKEPGDSQKDEFYILTHHEMAIVQAERNKCEFPFNWENCAILVAKGVDNVKTGDVIAYKDAWQKMIDFCQ